MGWGALFPIRFFLFSSVVLLLSLGPNAAASTYLIQCAQFLGLVARQEVGKEFSTTSEGHVLYNGIAVTGPETYPIKEVLENLGLSADPPFPWTGKRVLTVGEGRGLILDYLLHFKAKAKALDPWYGRNDFPHTWEGRLMREYIEKYGDYLIAGDAREMPLENQSVDLLLSHHLVNNLSKAALEAFHKEVWRVLDNGGEARLYGYASWHKEGATAFFTGLGGKVEWVVREYEWMSWWERRSERAWRLVVKKTSKPH